LEIHLIMPLSYDAVLDEMVATAREARALTLEHFKRFRDLEIGIKGPADFVSDADRGSELLISARPTRRSARAGWRRRAG